MRAAVRVYLLSLVYLISFRSFTISSYTRRPTTKQLERDGPLFFTLNPTHQQLERGLIDPHLLLSTPTQALFRHVLLSASHDVALQVCICMYVCVLYIYMYYDEYISKYMDEGSVYRYTCCQSHVQDDDAFTNHTTP